MTINSQDIIKYAYKLWTQRNCTEVELREVELRNIINRCYYGAFLTARDIAGIDNKSASVHREVIDFFSKSPKNPRIGNNLVALKKLRHKADYEPDANINSNDTKSCLTRAKKILEDLNNN